MTSTLESRIAALSDEIRGYPTPIARCDEQLTALIEERSRLLDERSRALDERSRSLDERSRLLGRLGAREEQGGCSPQNIWINDGGFHAA